MLKPEQQPSAKLAVGLVSLLMFLGGCATATPAVP